MVVSRGKLGCVVVGVFAKRLAFASSVLFILAVLWSPQVVVVVMLTDGIFLCREVVCLCRRLILS
jgi:hypothetical protein